MVQAWCLSAMGQGDKARKALSILRLLRKRNSLVALAMANTYAPSGGSHSDAERLKWINDLYRKAGLAALRLADDSRPLSFANLSAEPCPPILSDAKVSVIVPAYNCAQTIHYALDSLLAQSWTNIEIIVADDASTDNTAEVVQAYAARDGRVRYVGLPVNQGAYMARNAALAVATGDFVTTHDTDDWSHPQKIQCQAEHLISDARCPANYSHWARADADLFFLGKFRLREALIHQNYSSFMFRRSVLMELGGWDPVRVSGDSELVRRMQKAYPAQRPHGVSPSVPLSFSLVLSDSLTRAPATHGRTSWHGVRRCYSEASNYWLWHVADFPRIDGLNGHRSFPAPRSILPDRSGDMSSDIVLVADLSATGQESARVLAVIAAIRAKGLKLALFHWGRFENDPNAPPQRAVLQAAQDGEVVIIPPGTEIQAQKAVVLSPEVLQDRIDMPPRLSASRLFLIGQLGDMPSDQAGALSAAATEVFGMPALWASSIEAALEPQKQAEELGSTT